MAQRAGFKNIQIQAKPDLYELFEDTFQQSGANSKAEFQRILLDNYLSPEESNTPALKKAEENLILANEEIDMLMDRMALYETEDLKAILNKHKGEKLKFQNSSGKTVNIEINDLPDVFSAILNSVKIK